jgi:putative peptidoglycan lipid II flippase
VIKNINLHFIKQLLKSGVLLTIISLVAKFFGFVRELIVANDIGFSSDYDNYLIILTVSGVIVSGIKGCFVSLYSSYLITKKLTSEDLKYLSLSIALVMSLIYIPLHFFGIHYFYALSYSDLVIAFPGFITFMFLSLYSGIYSSHLIANKKFIKSELSTLFLVLLPIITLVIFWGLNLKIQLFSLSIMLLTGAVGEFIYLHIISENHKVNFNYKITDKGKAYIKDVLYLFSSSIVLSLMILIDVYFVKNLPEGVVSILLTSTKFIALGTGILASSLGSMAIPYLAESFNKSLEHFNSTIYKICAFTWGVCIFIMLTAWFLTPVLIPMLYKEQSITNEDINQLVSLIQYSLPVIPLFLSGMVLSRGMVVLGIANKMLIFNIIALIINILADYLFIYVYEFGVISVVISTTIVYLWTNIANLCAIKLYSKSQCKRLNENININ